LRTIGDGRAAFELADGVSLRVGEATEWQFRGPSRIELTAGTLYVDSGAGAASRGVEIATESGVVRDVGTQFEVRALSSGLRLRVREGLAELETAAGDRSVSTGAGEQLSIDARGAMQRRPIAADDAEWSWTQALATPPPLDGRSAFEVLTWIARETGKRLEFADAEVELRARSALLHGSSEGFLPLELLDVVIATTDQLDYSLGELTLTVRGR
jgi:ferric-dicitrate binding protein FerR (iron transport regulator)